MLSWKPAEEESYKMNRHWLCASCNDSFEWIWMHNPIKCSHTNSSLLKSGLLQDSIWNTSHQQLDAAAWFAPLLTFVIAGEKMWPVFFFLVFLFLFFAPISHISCSHKSKRHSKSSSVQLSLLHSSSNFLQGRYVIAVWGIALTEKKIYESYEMTSVLAIKQKSFDEIFFSFFSLGFRIHRAPDFRPQTDFTKTINNFR